MSWKSQLQYDIKHERLEVFPAFRYFGLNQSIYVAKANSFISVCGNEIGEK